MFRKGGVRDFSWVPLTLVAVFAVTLAVKFRALVFAIRTNSDAAFAEVFIENSSFPRMGGSMVNVGLTPHYSDLWLMALIEPLPHHRFVWVVSQMAILVATALLIAWAARQVANRPAAVTVLAVAVAQPIVMLVPTLAHALRAHTWLAGALLCAGLVYLTGRGEATRRGVRPLVMLAGVALLGVTVASDPLFLIVGVLPLLSASGLPWLRIRTPLHRKNFLRGLTVAAGGLILAYGLDRWMYGLGFRKTYLVEGFRFATVAQLLDNLKNLAWDALILTNSDFFGRPLDLWSVLRLLLAPLGLLAFAAPAILTFKVLRNADSGDSTRAGYLVYVTYWAASAVFTASAFVLLDVASGHGSATIRYLFPLYFAAAASFPLWASGTRTGRILAGAGSALFLILSIQQLSLLGTPNDPARDPALASDGVAIVEYLKEQRITRGYAGYWRSHSLTMSYPDGVLALPVWNCPNGDGGICPFYVNVSTEWYEPQRASRTFLVDDSSLVRVGGALALASLGAPSEQHTYPSGLTLYIFDHDIAREFGDQQPDIARQKVGDPFTLEVDSGRDEG